VYYKHTEMIKLKDLLDEVNRISRKPGQPANSKKHSDLYTDENPKGTIKGLKFATEEDAKNSVSKIKNSGKSHAHKIQAAVAMEQRARAAGKTTAAGVYRSYINSIKKSEVNELEGRCERLDNESDEAFITRCGNQGWGNDGGVGINLTPHMSTVMQKKIVIPIPTKKKPY